MTLIFQSIFTFLIAIASIILCKKINLLDIPDKRKKHKGLVPLAGGIVISLSLIFLLKFGKFDDYYLNSIIGYGILISLIGIIDDKYNLNVSSKLALITFGIFFLIKDGLIVNSLGQYDYLGDLKLGTLQVAFTFICVLFLINAFNYIDGTDGVCLGLFINGLLFLYFLNFHDTNLTDFLRHLIIISTILLFFNLSIFKLPKLFLGDGGSLILGFISAFLLIYCFKVLQNHPSALIWCFNIIIFDFISVNFKRFIQNKKMFLPGNDHIHHVVQKKFNSHIKTCILIITINSFVGLLGIYLSKINHLYSLLFFIIIFFIYYFYKNFITSKSI